MSWSVDGTRFAIPRGKVMFARKSAAGVLGPFFFLGNASKLDFATIGDDISEVIDFTSSTSAPAARIAKSRKPEFGISLYECSPQNLALMFMANPPAEYTQAATPITGETLQGGAYVGGLYQTAKFGPISAITVKKGATVFTVTTQYVVRDASLGIIEILALPGGVVAGDAITIDYTPTVYTAGSGFVKTLGGTAARIEGQLLFTGSNTTGPRENLTIWNCSLSSDGNFPFIGQDVVEFSLKANVLTDPAHADLFTVVETNNGTGVPIA